MTNYLIPTTIEALAPDIRLVDALASIAGAPIAVLTNADGALFFAVGGERIPATKEAKADLAKALEGRKGNEAQVYSIALRALRKRELCAYVRHPSGRYCYELAAESWYELDEAGLFAVAATGLPASTSTELAGRPIMVSERQFNQWKDAAATAYTKPVAADQEKRALSYFKKADPRRKVLGDFLKAAARNLPAGYKAIPAGDDPKTVAWLYEQYKLYCLKAQPKSPYEPSAFKKWLARYMDGIWRL